MQPVHPRRSPSCTAAIRSACFVAVAVLALASVAYAGRAKVGGVTNFGRLSDTVYRGGEVTSKGLENLHDMGVRTVVDLTGKKDGEKQACGQLGIKYYTFPMDADERPSDATVERILGILRDAREPVYVHCSAGKHRAGTISALYRIRVQGWPQERAWAEQQSYGFGSAKDHRRLYEYVYGRSASAHPSKDHATD